MLNTSVRISRSLRTKRGQLCVICCFVCLFFLQTIFYYQSLVVGVTRPVWDFQWKSSQLNLYKQIIPNYGYDPTNVELTCRLHNFTVREPTVSKINSRLTRLDLFFNYFY